MTYFTIIWNNSIENSLVQLNELQSKGYKIKTKSESVHIKILSCYFQTDITNLDIFTDFEKTIISNNNLIQYLERYENEVKHDELLRRVIYELGCDNLMTNIHSMKHSLSKKIATVPEVEIETKTLLENTYNEDLEKLCPLNVHDGSSFYYTNEENGELELLEPHHIFHYQGHCYNMDSIFRYIQHGGVINLDETYVKRFFLKSGYVSFKNEKMSTDDFMNKTYHIDTITLDISDNNITSLINSHLPNTIKTLLANGNPIGNNYHVDLEELKILNLSNCLIKDLNFAKIPSSVTLLDLSNNENITSFKNIDHMKNLRVLNLVNTGIKKIQYNQFNSLNKSHKDLTLKVTVSKGQKFTGSKPEWLKIIEK